MQINIVMLELLYSHLQNVFMLQNRNNATLNNSIDIKQLLIYSFKWSCFNILLFFLLDLFIKDRTIYVADQLLR